MAATIFIINHEWIHSIAVSLANLSDGTFGCKSYWDGRLVSILGLKQRVGARSLNVGSGSGTGTRFHSSVRDLSHPVTEQSHHQAFGWNNICGFSSNCREFNTGTTPRARGVLG